MSSISYIKKRLIAVRHLLLRGHIFRIIAIRKYLRNNQVPKLQVGCGLNFLAEWLNADAMYGDIYLNAIKKLPFEESSLNFVFCEHFLEHLSLDDGIRFLKDCHRVLKSSGVIRIATPDLERIIDLYFDKNKFVGRQEYAHKILGNPSLSPCVLFNNITRFWGHKFCYDKEFIKAILIKVGFANIVFCESGRSNHNELCDVERHGRNWGISWLDSAETLIVEASK